MFIRPRAIACLTAALLAVPIVAEANGLLHVRPEGYAFVDGLETSPLPADGWLALVCVDSACHLAPARAWVERATVETHDGTVDGEVLRGDAPPGTLALLRGLAGVQAGPVATEWINPRFPDFSAGDWTGEHGTAAPPTLAWSAATGLRSVSLVIEEASAEACWSGDCIARWWLHGDGEPVVLSHTAGDPVFGHAGLLAPADALVWAGDLDGDGRLDLLLRPQPRPDYLDLRLLLGRDRPATGEWPASAQFYWWDPANMGC